MASKKDIGVFILILAGVLVALTFIQATGDSVTEQTSFVRDNQSISIASARTPAVNNNVNNSINFTVRNGLQYSNRTPIANFVLQNATGAVVGANNYTIDLISGNFSLRNSTYWTQTPANTTYAIYDYKNINYVEDNGSRTVISIIMIFCAIGILGFVITAVLKSNSMENLLKFGGGNKVGLSS